MSLRAVKWCISPMCLVLLDIVLEYKGQGNGYFTYFERDHTDLQQVDPNYKVDVEKYTTTSTVGISWLCS